MSMMLAYVFFCPQSSGQLAVTVWACGFVSKGSDLQCIGNVGKFAAIGLLEMKPRLRHKLT